MNAGDLSADVSRIEKAVAAGACSADSPYLIMLSGLPGTGKSTLCRKLREHLPVVVVESDAVRMTLFARPTFSVEESERVFDVVHLAIAGLLKKGLPVVMDATNLMERHRATVYGIAEACGLPLIIVRVEAAPAVVKERLEQRAASNSAPYAADWEVYRRMRFRRERISRGHIGVNTSKGLDQALEAIVAAVESVLRKQEA